MVSFPDAVLASVTFRKSGLPNVLCYYGPMRFGSRLILVLGITLFTLPPAMAEAPAKESHLARIQESGKLVLRGFPQIDSPFVTVLLDQGPMKSVGNRSNFGGIDVEILSRLADRLGVELEVRPIREPLLTLLLDSLQEGDGDISGGGLTITPERQEKVLFSRGYVKFFGTALVRADHFPEVEDLPTLRLAVLKGSTFDDMFKDLGLPEERLDRGDFNIASIERLISHQSDVVFYDSCAMPEEAGFSLRAAFRFEKESHLGYALPLGSDLKPILDEMIDELEASGQLNKILDPGLQRVDVENLPVIRPEDFCTDC